MQDHQGPVFRCLSARKGLLPLSPARADRNTRIPCPKPMPTHMMGVVGDNNIETRAYNARRWADTELSQGCGLAALPKRPQNHQCKALSVKDGLIRRDRDPAEILSVLAIIRKQHAAAQPGPCLPDQRRVAFQSLKPSGSRVTEMAELGEDEASQKGNRCVTEFRNARPEPAVNRLARFQVLQEC